MAVAAGVLLVKVRACLGTYPTMGLLTWALNNYADLMLSGWEVEGVDEQLIFCL